MMHRGSGGKRTETFVVLGLRRTAELEREGSPW